MTGSDEYSPEPVKHERSFRTRTPSEEIIADLKAKVEAIHETPSMVLEGANPFDYSEILAIQIVTQHIINEIDAALKSSADAETSRAAPKEERA